MVVEVEAWSNPTELFRGPYLTDGNLRTYDVAPDGRFLMIEIRRQVVEPTTHLKLVLNWFQELERRVPSQ